MLESQLLYSFAPVGYEELANIPTLARSDAILGDEMARYVLIEKKPIIVRRGGQRDYYFCFDVSIMKNVVTYVKPEQQIFTCNDKFE